MIKREGETLSSLLYIIMNNLNEFDYQQLENLINKLVEKKVYEILNNLGVESTSFGKIVGFDKVTVDEEGNVTEVTRASVELPNGEIVRNLYNSSNQILKFGDKVKVFGSKSDLSNRYIGIKYEKDVIL